MSKETSTVSHLFDVMSTDQGDITETTGEHGVTSSPSRGAELYFTYFVIVIGLIGTVSNGLVLYALVASKQHKKHELIVNQNALDLYSCLFLFITYGLRLFNIQLTGSLGYWLCMLLFSQSLLASGLFASWINLMVISIERYLKIVYPTWSKKKLRKWMTYAAIACVWISGFVNEMANVFQTSAVIDGVCYGYVIVKTRESRLAIALYYFVFSYVLVLLILTFCYGKILMVIRRQARVMASHSTTGSSTASQAQSSKIQSSLIKTMILVCVFYALAWLPEKIYILFIALDVSLNLLDSGYYATIGLGFLYICTNLHIIPVYTWMILG